MDKLRESYSRSIVHLSPFSENTLPLASLLPPVWRHASETAVRSFFLYLPARPHCPRQASLYLPSPGCHNPPLTPSLEFRGPRSSRSLTRTPSKYFKYTRVSRERVLRCCANVSERPSRSIASFFSVSVSVAHASRGLHSKSMKGLLTWPVRDGWNHAVQRCDL